MFYDLDIPWTGNFEEAQKTLSFLGELGYNIVALNHHLPSKLPNEIENPIPDNLPFAVPSKVQVLTRCTLPLTSSSANHRIAALSSLFDLVAVRPVDESTFNNACRTLDVALISLDLTQRLSFYFKSKTLLAAVERGVAFEICYAQGILGDAQAKRNLISNATQLIRATKGRGLVISSEARTALGLRAPADVVNLGVVWGLSQDKARDTITRIPKFVAVQARMKKSSYRGVVDIVDVGAPSKPAPSVSKKAHPPQKRKFGMREAPESGAGASNSMNE